MKAGVPGMIQAALVIPVVWYACYFIARKLKVDDEFSVMLSTAVSICGSPRPSPPAAPSKAIKRSSPM
jgi:uncharacterized membrane protein YadS